MNRPHSSVYIKN